MTKTKRIIALILTLLTVASLAGCKNNNTSSETPSKGSASVDPSIFIEENREEDLSDFKAELVLTDKEDVTSYCIDIDEENEYSEYYLINFNHREDMFEINFYNIAMEKIEINDYSYEARDFKCKIPTNMLQYNCYMQYCVPEVIPDLIISFVSKGGNNIDYLITYNGRDGGASLIPITEEMLTSNNGETVKIELNEDALNNTENN